MADTQNLKTFVLRLADDRLILGQRLSEWCGHAPVLEEDLALANIALDMIGHASALYRYASELDGTGKEEDYFAYFRDDVEFMNFKLCELPKGDFAFTIARQFLFSIYSYLLYEELVNSNDENLAGMAAKHFKEIKYHYRHSREWVLRLGDGTEESARRISEAFEELWSYTGEIFTTDDIEAGLISEGIIPDIRKKEPQWRSIVEQTLTEASLQLPDWKQWMHKDSRKGMHTEHLGHLLAQMQFLRRSHPEADWQ